MLARHGPAQQSLQHTYPDCCANEAAHSAQAQQRLAGCRAVHFLSCRSSWNDSRACTQVDSRHSTCF
jgi:hypothetical protein